MECHVNANVYVHGWHYRAKFCEMMGNLRKKKVVMKELLHD